MSAYLEKCDVKDKNELIDIRNIVNSEYHVFSSLANRIYPFNKFLYKIKLNDKTIGFVCIYDDKDYQPDFLFTDIVLLKEYRNKGISDEIISELKDYFNNSDYFIFINSNNCNDKVNYNKYINVFDNNYLINIEKINDLKNNINNLEDYYSRSKIIH